MKTILAKSSLLLTLFVALLFAGCSKTNEERGNYVKLDNVSYAITSAVYFVDNGNLTIQFETAEPDVFLYFRGRSSIPLGETNVSYESLDDNCTVTYCFESEDYISIDGTTTISLSNGDYTINAEGHVLSLSNEDKTFKIHYEGDITDVTQTGSGGGHGSSSGGSVISNDFKLGPGFSFIESAGGSGSIKVYCDNDAMAWSAESNADWCQLTNGSGVGDGSFEFTVERNLTNTDRKVQIIVKSNDGTTRWAWVFQKPGAYDLVVKPDKLEFGALGSLKTVHVYAVTGLNQHSWTTSCDASWVHLSQTSGTGNTDIQVTLDRNTHSSDRSSLIRFVSESGTVRFVTINQKAGGNAPASYLIYDGEEIEMKSVCFTDTYSFNIFGTTTTQTFLYPGYEGKDEHGHIIYRVRLSFQDYPSGIPVGDFVYGTTYNLDISIIDPSNHSHSASSGNVSITKNGSTYTMNGSGITGGKSFSFTFKGKITSTK